MRKVLQELGQRVNFSLSMLLRLLGVGAVGMVLIVLLVQENRAYRHESSEVFREVMESYLRRVALGFEVMHLDPYSSDSVDQVRIRELISSPIFSNTGYLFLILPSGRIEYHFYRQGASISPSLMEEMANTPSRMGMIEWMPDGEGGEMREVYFSYYPDFGCYLAVEANRDNLQGGLRRIYRYSWLAVLGILLFIWWSIGLGTRRFIGFLQSLIGRLARLSRGERAERLEAFGSREVAEISTQYNQLVEGLERVSRFASDLQKGDWNAEYEPLGTADTLGKALLDLRDSMKRNEAETLTRQRKDEERNWSNEGLAKFARLLREYSDNIDVLTDAVLEELVNYLDAVQGGLYVVHERENGAQYLKLESAFAYSRKKFMQVEMEMGEGLVGTCAIERDIIHLDTLPPEYCDITSGIGYVPPRELLVFPLKTDDGLFGVIELASLKGFSPYVVEFAQTLAVSIAQAMQLVINTQNTNALLARQTEQSEMMRNQEEELRQNIEELNATQEQIVESRAKDEAFRQMMSRAILYVELSQEGNILSANEKFDAFLRGLGYKYGQFDIFSVMRPLSRTGEGRDELALCWGQVLHGEQVEVVLECQAAGGELRYVHATLVLADNGMREMVVLMGQEVSSLIRSLAPKPVEE